MPGTKRRLRTNGESFFLQRDTKTPMERSDVPLGEDTLNAAPRLALQKTRSGKRNSPLASEPVHGELRLPPPLLLAVAAGAVVARLRVSVVDAARRPAAARRQLGGAAQRVVSDRRAPAAPRVRVGAEAVGVTPPRRGLGPGVVRRVELGGVGGRQAGRTQGGGALRVVLGVGGALRRRAVPGERGVGREARVGGRRGAAGQLAPGVQVAVGVKVLRRGAGSLVEEGGPGGGRRRGGEHGGAQRRRLQGGRRRRRPRLRPAARLLLRRQGAVDAAAAAAAALPLGVPPLLLLLAAVALLGVGEVPLDHLLLEGLPVAGGEEAGEDQLPLALHGGAQDAHARLHVGACSLSVLLPPLLPAAPPSSRSLPEDGEPFPESSEACAVGGASLLPWRLLKELFFFSAASGLAPPAPAFLPVIKPPTFFFSLLPRLLPKLPSLLATESALFLSLSLSLSLSFLVLSFPADPLLEELDEEEELFLASDPPPLAAGAAAAASPLPLELLLTDSLSDSPESGGVRASSPADAVGDSG
ncbi:hypothetical protein EYF80_052693 [Liparis tanakae]|uniref:Uncharacterized protein n=1 Tax=Liparis tanakae TaxID=230148 RepID=A0A4Z2F7G9_9TELE|nr:hypothetical protein EYF80_052693 [Liparis tanakae]